jgi:hypothetical protein
LPCGIETAKHVIVDVEVMLCLAMTITILYLKACFMAVVFGEFVD